MPRNARLLSTLAAALLVALAAPPCRAHDFWLEPTTFRPAPGTAVGLGLRVGERFTGDALPREERLIERFVVAGPAGEARVAGVDGVAPAGVFAPAAPGLYAVGYASGDSVAVLDAATWARYVEQEGLAPQLAGAAPEPPVRDAFSRSAKALLRVPGGDGGGYDRRLGLPLELVALADPRRPAPGGRRFALLVHGRPLAGVLVSALHRDDPSRPVSARTGGDGEVRLALDRPGVWLLKAVRVEPAPQGSGADLHSTWASLTFELETP